MTRFEECLKIVLGFEGGDSDDPADRGGKTRWGITQNTLDRWCYITGNEKLFIFAMDKAVRDDVYELLYWQPAGCEHYPYTLGLVVFDAAVNHGVSKAVRLLQGELGCTPDGRVGVVTRKRAEECNAKRIASAIIARRVDFYHSIVKADHTQERFLKGWLNRMKRLESEISK